MLCALESSENAMANSRIKVFFIINGVISEQAKVQNYQTIKAEIVFMSSATIKMAAPDIAEAAEKIDNRTKVYFLLLCVVQSLNFGRTQSAAIAAEIVELAIEVGLVVKHSAIASEIGRARRVPHIVSIRGGGI